MANTASSVHPTSPRRRQQRRAGFSLVEVVISIGMVSFGLLAILGTLPVGLKSVQDSQAQEAQARITQNVRSLLQQLSFGDQSQGSYGTDVWDDKSGATVKKTTVTNLKEQTLYYTAQGSACESGDAFYEVKFDNKDAETIAPAGSTEEFNPLSAQKVLVTLTSPKGAPEENKRKKTIALFVAKQRND